MGDFHAYPIVNLRVRVHSPQADSPENAARWKDEISGAIDALIREARSHSKGGFVYGDAQLRLLRTLSTLHVRRCWFPVLWSWPVCDGCV